MLSSHKAYYARLGLHPFRDPARLPPFAINTGSAAVLRLLLLLKRRGKELYVARTPHKLQCMRSASYSQLRMEVPTYGTCLRLNRKHATFHRCDAIK